MSLSDNRPRRTRWRTLYSFIVVWLLLSSVSWVALAAPTVLVIVRAADQTDPAPYELRLRSELAAEGVVSVVVNPMSTPNETKQVAAKFGATAIVEVGVSSSEVTTSIWAADPSLGLEVTRNLRVSTRERDAVGVFALRTVDFLQGARIELEQQRQAKLASSSASTNTAPNAGGDATAAATPVSPPPEKPKTETKQVSAPAAPTRKPLPPVSPPQASPVEKTTRQNGRKHVRLAPAYSLLRSSDEFHWATAPSLAVDWYFSPRMAVGVVGAGPYINHVNSKSDQYSISVDQEYLALDFRVRFEIAHPVDLEPHIATGLARYSANATLRTKAAEGLVGHHANVWSVFSMGGLTLAWRIGTHFRLLGDVDALVKWQVPKVEAAGAVVTEGSPWNLVVRLGPGWAF